MQRPFWKYHNYDKLMDIFNKLILSCGDNKIKFIVVPLVDNSSIKGNRLKSQVRTFFSKFKNLLSKECVSILFESDFHPIEFKKFIESFSCNNFGINYDTGNSASLGYVPTEEILYYRKLIKNVHIKDRVYQSNTVMLGKGDADLELIVRLLKKINYKGCYILQTYRSSKNYIKDLKANLEYFKRIING